MSNATTAKPSRQCHLQWVPADDLGVNPVAQREFQPRWAQEIYENFDLDKMQVPHVNERPDGSLMVMEGQHTVWAYRQWIGGEKQLIQVWLYKGLSEQEEAEFFLSLNNRKNIKALPKFRSAITAARPVECDIDRIVRLNGCTIGGSGGNAIQALGAIQTIYTRHGGASLGLVLRVVRDAFTDGGFERPVLLGVSMVIARYPEVDIPNLVLRLSRIKNGWKGLIQRTYKIRSAMGCMQTEACAAAIVDVYNATGRGGKKLPSWWRDAA